MINFQSDTWHQIARWAEAERGKVRAKNDTVWLGEAEANALRGELRFIKRLLDLPNGAAREVRADPDE